VEQESVTLVNQFFVAKRKDGTVYIEQLVAFENLLSSDGWVKVKGECTAKGMQFIATVHCFQSESGELSMNCNTSEDASEEDKRLLDSALLDIRYADLFLENLQHGRAWDVLTAHSCEDCVRLSS
jgi:hypothetical protein